MRGSRRPFYCSNVMNDTDKKSKAFEDNNNNSGELKGSASQLNKLVVKDSPHIKKLSGTNLFPRSRHQYIYQLSKNPCPKRAWEKD